MTQDSEKYIERKLVAAIKAKGGMCIKLQADYLSGLPDRLCLLNGRSVFVELKSKGKKPRKLQTAVHEKLNAAGFGVFVIDSINGIEQVINYLII